MRSTSLNSSKCILLSISNPEISPEYLGNGVNIKDEMTARIDKLKKEILLAVNTLAIFIIY